MSSEMNRKITNPELFRENVRNKIAIILQDNTMSTNLEKGIYNYTIKEANTQKIVKKWENPAFSQLYLDRLRSIYVNLKNEELLKQIIQNEITPQSVAFMTHQEMNPSHWRILIDRKIKRDASKYTSNIEASTDMFTCKKCKSKRCTYYELQTRSADEPATIFVTCLDCGKHWKS
jgi:transcription elongation factor S-II